MYVCLECGKTFEEPRRWTEDYGQSFLGSPCCHENYEEVLYCECGNIKEPYHKYCERCEELIKIENERLRDSA